MRGLDVLILAVIGQIQRKYVKPEIRGKERYEFALGSDLKVNNSALQLRRFEVAKCLQGERIVKHQQIFLVGDQKVAALAVLEANGVVVGLGGHDLIQASGEQTHQFNLIGVVDGHEEAAGMHGQLRGLVHHLFLEDYLSFFALETP